MRRIGPPAEELSDEVLLAGLSAGDQDLAIAFVRRFQAKVFGVALAVLGDRRSAEDVAQQAFERAWRNAKVYDPLRGSVGAWLSVITRNLAIDAARVRPVVPIDGEELVERLSYDRTPGHSPEQAAVMSESSGVLRRALRGLPPEQARAVVLAGIGGLSASQVAVSEGIPLGTAKTRIRTALHRLRAAMSDAGIEGG